VIDNADAARLAGVNVPRTFLLVFALASALGGLAGYLIVAAHEQVTPMLGMWSTLKGMIAMMLGGLGSLPGAVVGGLALGLLEAHSQWLAGPQFRDLVAYLVLFALLALRPAGLWAILARKPPAAA
jgi:branched-subunit amino acid ABC-type transport system permease component